MLALLLFHRPTTYGEFNVFDLGDDEGLRDVLISRLRDELLRTLGQNNFKRFVDYFYG